MLGLLILWQHRLMHRVDWLWRMHRLHHTDLSPDVSSGVRFHPLEILFSMGLKIGAALLLGTLPLAVLAFEILLNGFAMFTHVNLAIPARVNAQIRWLLVKQDMRRIHHSVQRDEHDTNVGYHVSCRNRLLRSYRRLSRQPQATMKLALSPFRAPPDQRLGAPMAQPFRGKSSLI